MIYSELYTKYLNKNFKIPIMHILKILNFRKRKIYTLPQFHNRVLNKNVDHNYLKNSSKLITQKMSNNSSK